MRIGGSSPKDSGTGIGTDRQQGRATTRRGQNKPAAKRKTLRDGPPEAEQPLTPSPVPGSLALAAQER